MRQPSGVCWHQAGRAGQRGADQRPHSRQGRPALPTAGCAPAQGVWALERTERPLPRGEGAGVRLILSSPPPFPHWGGGEGAVLSRAFPGPRPAPSPTPQRPGPGSWLPTQGDRGAIWAEPRGGTVPDTRQMEPPSGKDMQTADLHEQVSGALTPCSWRGWGSLGCGGPKYPRRSPPPNSDRENRGQISHPSSRGTRALAKGQMATPCQRPPGRWPQCGQSWAGRPRESQPSPSRAVSPRQGPQPLGPTPPPQDAVDAVRRRMLPRAPGQQASSQRGSPLPTVGTRVSLG